MVIKESKSVLAKSEVGSWQNKAIYFFCAVIIIGLFTGKQIRVLPSIAIIGLVLTGLLQKNFKVKLKQIGQQRAFVAFMAIFVIHLLTFFYSDAENYPAFQEGIVLKISLFLLPLAFGLLPGITKLQFYRLNYIFLICVFAAAIYSVNHYFQNYDFVNESYIRSKVMETWVNHIRFSLMVVLAIFIGCRLYQKEVYFFHKSERYFILAATIFLFIYAHMLAVRSGLVALYGVIGLGLLYLFFIRKKFLLAIGLGLLFLLVPVISYFTLPTFYNKFHNTLADINKVEEGGSASSANDYSLVGRVYSYKVGKILMERHPFFGTGVGNFRAEMGETYRQHFPEIKESSHLLPHNQYMYMGVLLGLIGFVLFLLFFFYPLFAHARQADILFVVQYIIVALSFFFEPTLETQLGLQFSIFFILLPIFELKNKGPQNSLS